MLEETLHYRRFLSFDDQIGPESSAGYGERSQTLLPPRRRRPPKNAQM